MRLMPTFPGVLIAFVVCCWLIIRLLKRRSDLRPAELACGFAIKVLLGLVYGYIFHKYYNGDDTWAIHRASITETQLLLSDPATFFAEYGPTTAIAKSSGFIEMIANYLNDLEYFMLAKSLAFVNPITGSNYYINSVLFNFIAFIGHYRLYKFFRTPGTDGRMLLYFACFFFLPAVFWLSGIRAEGLMLVFFSLILYAFERNKRAGPRIFFGLVGFVGLLILRPVFALLVVPAAVAWGLTVYYKRKTSLAFVGVYGVAAMIFFASMLFSPSGGLGGVIINEQESYFRLKGNTVYDLTPLEANAGSFIRVLPEAIANSFFRPFPWEVRGLFQWLAAIENICVLLILIVAVRFGKEKWRSFFSRPEILLGLFYAISVYLVIGYVVPFPGAIIRYRALAELVLVCILIANTRNIILDKKLSNLTN
jgi:hypothetical protein